MPVLSVAAVSVTTSSVWTTPSVPLTPPAALRTDVSVMPPTTTTTATVQPVRIILYSY